MGDRLWLLLLQPATNIETTEQGQTIVRAFFSLSCSRARRAMRNVVVVASVRGCTPSIFKTLGVQQVFRNPLYMPGDLRGNFFLERLRS